MKDVSSLLQNTRTTFTITKQPELYRLRSPFIAHNSDSPLFELKEAKFRFGIPVAEGFIPVVSFQDHGQGTGPGIRCLGSPEQLEVGEFPNQVRHGHRCRSASVAVSL